MNIISPFLIAFFDRCIKHVDRLIIMVSFFCVMLFCADFIYHKHVHFTFEAWVGFFSLYGLLAYFLIVLSAKQLRKLLKREEDYYQTDDHSGNPS